MKKVLLANKILLKDKKIKSQKTKKMNNLQMKIKKI